MEPRETPELHLPPSPGWARPNEMGSLKILQGRWILRQQRAGFWSLLAIVLPIGIRASATDQWSEATV
eukprot:scaffold1499_cov255-Pinguiococcus_pyrenoidosus.AAC.33